MNTSRQIKTDLFYIGASDRRLALFENMMPVPRGVSYNSYVLLDEKTVLLDTADNAVGAQFLENLQAVLAGRPLDYIIIHHVEPDHLALLLEIVSHLSRELGPEQAAVFAASHFDWLDAYRSDINSRAQLSTDPVIAQACLFYSDCMVLVQQFVKQCCSSSEESFDENNLCETETNHAKVEEVVLQ